MADIYANRRSDAPAQGRSIGKLTNAAGAAVSFALIIGVGVWGYNLLVRDVSGVPVVRAAEGPMRVAPEDPGGQTADHQGLAVNTVAAVGSAAAPASRLTLAPEPVKLMDEDTTATALRHQNALATATPPDAAPRVIADVGTTSPDPTDRPIDVMSMVAQLTADAQPLGALSQEPSDENDAAALTEETTSGLLITGMGTSLRPQLRPEGLKLASLDATVPAAAPNQIIDGNTLPAGTRLAQLGAYDSADVANREWLRIQTRFSDLLAGKTPVVQQAQSGGRTFYRLRAMGFVDLNDARRFCSALVAENADCIPVVTR